MDHLPIHPLHRQLNRLGRRELAERLSSVRALSTARGLRFLDDRSRPKTIALASIPWILTSHQMAFFQRVATLLADALTRLPGLYAQHRAVRQVLPFDAVQESWIRLAHHPKHRPLAVMGRFDSTATFSHAGWRRAFAMLEPNAVGVGGVHYAPTACSIILDVFGDCLERAFPGRRIVPTPDPRLLLLEELAQVGRRLGRRVRRVALLENRDYTTGTDEFASLARHLSRQPGLEGVVTDPRDIRLSRGRLMARGKEIDFIYRDCELSEFIEIEDAGHRLDAMRQAIRQGRLISGLLWEFDQKSTWELFTDPAWSRHFTPAQQRLFREHLPWTRLVRETFTLDPAGARVDLVRYAARHRGQLVLKPNTLYGGQGVVIGSSITQAAWERQLIAALRGDERYVVQRRAAIGVERFPMLDGGRVRQVERRVVSGFFFNSFRAGLIGRFSADPVVNVSRGGGLLCALMAQ